MRSIKNIILALLVGLCLYQTLRLWFDNFPNQDFFSNFISRNRDIDESGAVSNLLRPYRIVTGLGENIFYVNYTNLDDLWIYSLSDNILSEMFKHGEYIGGGDIDWAALLTLPGVIYEYHYRIPANVYAEAKKQRPTFFSSRMEAFDMIFLIPDTNEKTLRILFADSAAGYGAEFRISDQSMISELNSNIENSVSADGLIYESSRLSSYAFGSNFLLARSGSDGYVYKTVRPINTFGDDSYLINAVERNIEAFFDDPAKKWKENDTVAGIFTFSDENTVVKYHSAGLFEYSSWKSGDGTSDTFISAYISAISFINKDTGITNEFYLSEYSNESGAWRFYFNVKLNNMPVTLSVNIQERLNLKSYIEVTVTKDTVSHYRRYAYSFTTVEHSGFLSEISYTNAINALVFIYGVDEQYLDDIAGFSLGYQVNDTRALELMWNIEYDTLYISIPSGQQI